MFTFADFAFAFFAPCAVTPLPFNYQAGSRGAAPEDLVDGGVCSASLRSCTFGAGPYGAGRVRVCVPLYLFHVRACAHAATVTRGRPLRAEAAPRPMDPGHAGAKPRICAPRAMDPGGRPSRSKTPRRTSGFDTTPYC